MLVQLFQQMMNHRKHIHLIESLDNHITVVDGFCLFRKKVDPSKKIKKVGDRKKKVESFEKADFNDKRVFLKFSKVDFFEK
jgi:hypothetical protein